MLSAARYWAVSTSPFTGRVLLLLLSLLGSSLVLCLPLALLLRPISVSRLIGIPSKRVFEVVKKKKERSAGKTVGENKHASSWFGSLNSFWLIKKVRGIGLLLSSNIGN